MNLNDLQIALIQNDANGVHSVIDHIDRVTENELFRKAGEHFGFPTDVWSGRRVGYQGHLAEVMAYSDPSGLAKLAARYDLEVIKPDWSGQNVRTSLTEVFGLTEKTSRAKFFTWSTFLVAGMVATTARADEIKLYLLNCERAARIGGGLMDIGKARDAKLKAAGNVITLINRAVRIPDPKMRQLALEHLDEALDGALKIPRQQNLFE